MLTELRSNNCLRPKNSEEEGAPRDTWSQNTVWRGGSPHWAEGHTDRGLHLWEQPSMNSPWAACMCTRSLSHVQLLWPHGRKPTRLLCPWDFPGKNTGVGCQFLLQGIFPTQGSNSSLLNWQAGSLPLSHQGNPSWATVVPKGQLRGQGVD